MRYPFAYRKTLLPKMMKKQTLIILLLVWSLAYLNTATTQTDNNYITLDGIHKFASEFVRYALKISVSFDDFRMAFDHCSRQLAVAER